ncbi:protein CUSTOS [Esox lucius]|uniref:protein CUSTOS n=1 Tax=Esox lucius TaxID=8010 RepID=UPI0014771EA5|nr:protein CUSTOS [Esox lucius]
MSAPIGTTVEDSSSEDDLERFKEATWSFPTCGNNDVGNKLSRRVSVSKHEHDGNELQTTPEFRLHVAKKLGAILDSCISVIPAETSKPPPCTESTKCEDEEGFRLFTTSIPGALSIEQPPPLRQRPVPSSSDSDSEMEVRLREAAVSVTDLVASALPLAVVPSLSEPPASKKIKKKKKKDRGKAEEAERQDSNVSPAPKKKKRRKTSQGDCGVVKNGGESSTDAKTEDQKRPEDSQPRKAKKKKKQKVSD